MYVVVIVVRQMWKRQGELKAEPLDTFVKGLRDGSKCKEAGESKARSKQKGTEDLIMIDRYNTGLGIGRD